MDKIRNAQNGDSDINSVALSTSTVGTCMSTVIELENAVFIYHIESSDFIASDTCSITDAHAFLMAIFKKVYRLDKKPVFKKVYLIGGLNTDQYVKLKNEIDRIGEDPSIITNENRTARSDSFYLFINSIKMNLIDFNIKSKTLHGTNKRPYDNDSPNDYIMDCTVIYDRSFTPYIFAVYQFGGREHQMNCIRYHSLLLGIYVIDQVDDSKSNSP
ncbi:unnamed protein product [Adineta steineri]|uniref:Uncharacterized protein n=1 Tax=Adineta steineri TaxID=433720 RepID=A0A815U3L9_9BILA|nr:unnamed protein product [Adineta steineri]CAF1648247.1 unnamed protein product [Adineta steineri]